VVKHGLRPELDLVLPLVLHAGSDPPDEEGQHFLLSSGPMVLLQILPVLAHPLEEVLGGDEVSVLPGLVEEGGLEAVQELVKGGVLSPLLQHQPHHHQLVVEVLRGPHDLHLLALLEPHLVHLQDLGDEGAGDLPGSLAVEEVSDVAVDVGEEGVLDRAVVLGEVLLLDGFAAGDPLFSVYVEVAHLPLQLLLQVQRPPELLVAVVELMVVLLFGQF